MDLGPISKENQFSDENEPDYQDTELVRLIPDPFLDTAYRLKVEVPTGVISYFDYVALPDDADGQGKFKLETKQKFFECGTQQISASLTVEQINDLDKMFGVGEVDMNDVISNELLSELLHSMESDLYNRYKELGDISRRKYFGKTKLILEDKLGIKLDIIIKNDNIPRRLGTKILACANKIAFEGRRGPANFIVTNSKLGSILMEFPGFIYSVENAHPSKISPIGQFAGMTVFVNPFEMEDVVIIGANTKEHDPGIFIGEYKSLLRKCNFVDKDFVAKRKISLISRRGTVVVGSKPSDRFYTMRVKLSNETGPTKKILLSMLKNTL